MRARPSCVAVLALALAACSRDPLSWPAGRDGGRADLRVAPDMAATTCAQPFSTWRVPWPIKAIRRTAGPDPRLGATEQLVVTVDFGTECAGLAGVEVVLQPGDATDFVDLRASAWTVEGDCGASAHSADWMIAIPGGQFDNPRVVVRDGNFPMGGVGLMYGRTACTGSPDCLCAAGQRGSGGENAACVTDCSCKAGLSCIGHYTLKGERWTCRRPCNDLLDCPAPATCQTRVADDAEFVCSATIDQCAKDDECPSGYRCEGASPGRACVDHRTRGSGASCRCFADCTSGQWCVGTTGAAACRFPCRRDLDCPGGASQIYYVCNPATSVCEPAGD